MLEKHRAPMRRLCFFLAAVSSGCAGGPVPVQITSLRQDENDDLLMDEAFGILGLTWEHSDVVRGTLHIHLVDDPPSLDDLDFGGITMIVKPRCHKAVVARRTPNNIAHEVVHALQRDAKHVCEDPCPPELADNLMAGATQTLGSELTSEQMDEIERGYNRFTRCR